MRRLPADDPLVALGSFREPTLLKAKYAKHMQPIEMGRLARKHGLIDRLGLGDPTLSMQAHSMFHGLHAARRISIPYQSCLIGNCVGKAMLMIERYRRFGISTRRRSSIERWYPLRSSRHISKPRRMTAGVFSLRTARSISGSWHEVA